MDISHIIYALLSISAGYFVGKIILNWLGIKSEEKLNQSFEESKKYRDFQ